MMNDCNSAEKEHGNVRNLDERLTRYYGAAQPERPLPVSSWESLRSQLGTRRPPRFRFTRQCHARRVTRRGRVPAFVQAAFSHMTYEARLPFGVSMLRCSIRRHARVPQVHVSLLHKRHIRLHLPSLLEGTIEPSALDVLLATGLARYLSMRKASYILPRFLLLSIVPFACLALILLRLAGMPLLYLLIAFGLLIVLSVTVLWLLDKGRRVMAERADSLMVQWLGRGRACEGLRALADLSHAPSRRKWGEPSLTERIGRVCGTQVALEQERLTLVK
jgi:hypothetical protein